MAPTRQTRRKPTSPPDDPVTAYARDVVAGRVVHGPHVRNACRRHLLDLEEGPKRGLTWDVTAAWRAIQFFPDVLRLNGGQFEGRPFDLHPSQASASARCLAGNALTAPAAFAGSTTGGQG